MPVSHPDRNWSQAELSAACYLCNNSGCGQHLLQSVVQHTIIDVAVHREAMRFSWIMPSGIVSSAATASGGVRQHCMQLVAGPRF